MERYNETSPTTKFKQTLYGIKKNVFTLAIGTAENPMGEILPEEVNKERRNNLIRDIERLRLKYYTPEDKYDNDEKPLLIVNINIDYCKYLFGPKKYNQESFIFGVTEDDKIVFYYYKQEMGKFVCLDRETRVMDKPFADNFFTKFGNFKFSIPFSIFEKGICELGDRLEEDFGWNERYREYLKASALAEGKTLKHFWEYNCTHFLTENQEKARLERIKGAEEEIERAQINLKEFLNRK